MFRHPLYLTYGAVLLAFTGWAEYRGWSLDRATEIRGVPRTVRDNPGAYRSHYAGFPRYIGGK